MFIVTMMCVMGISIFTTILATNLSNHGNSSQMSPGTRFIIFGVLARCVCQKMSSVDTCEVRSATQAVSVITMKNHQDAKGAGEPSESSASDDQDANRMNESTETIVNQWQTAAEIIDQFSFSFVFGIMLTLVLGTIVTGVIWQMYVVPKQLEAALLTNSCPLRP